MGDRVGRDHVGRFPGVGIGRDGVPVAFRDLVTLSPQDRQQLGLVVLQSPKQVGCHRRSGRVSKPVGVGFDRDSQPGEVVD